MAIAHAISGEVLDLLTPGTHTTPDKTTALFKASDLEVMRLVLAAGKRMPDHSVAGSITLQCLRGKVDLLLPDRTSSLQAGQFAYVGGGVPHGLYAQQDCELLLTIAILGSPQK